MLGVDGGTKPSCRWANWLCSGGCGMFSHLSPAPAVPAVMGSLAAGRWEGVCPLSTSALRQTGRADTGYSAPPKSPTGNQPLEKEAWLFWALEKIVTHRNSQNQ